MDEGVLAELVAIDAASRIKELISEIEELKQKIRTLSSLGNVDEALKEQKRRSMDTMLTLICDSLIEAYQGARELYNNSKSANYIEASVAKSETFGVREFMGLFQAGLQRHSAVRQLRERANAIRSTLGQHREGVRYMCHLTQTPNFVEVSTYIKIRPTT